MRPEYLFVSSADGALYDTRRKNWSTQAPLRPQYARPCHSIAGTGDLRATLRGGAFYPGYGIVFHTSDGASLCPACVRKEYRQISASIRARASDGWRVVAAYCADQCSEGESCEHCGTVLDPFHDPDAPYCKVCGENHENPCNDDDSPEPGEMRETD